jgi:integrase
MHDLRHTCAMRMARDDRLSLRDVQTILGHAHLSTTVDVYLIEDERDVIARVAAHLADREVRDRRPPPSAPAVGYDAADLAVLFTAVRR